MKRIIAATLFCLCSAMQPALAGTPSYYYFDASRIAIKTVYNAKGEVVGTQEYSVTKPGANTVHGQNAIIKPGKDTEITGCTYSIADGKLMISMGRNAAGREVFLDYRTVTGGNSDIIRRTGFETDAKLAGKSVRVTCTITNRKVFPSAETISSRAGNWECVRSEYDMELRGRVFGIGIPVHVRIVEWYAPGFGIVRTDIYRRGKLHETRLLTGFKGV